MRLTSTDIREQTFNKKFRGFDQEEVNTFIQMVADDFDEFEKENKVLKNKLKDCKLEIESLQGSEGNMGAEVKKDRNSPMEVAERKARELLVKAKKKAKEIKEIAMNEAMTLEQEMKKIRYLKKQELSKKADPGSDGK